MNFFPVKLR